MPTDVRRASSGVVLGVVALLTAAQAPAPRASAAEGARPNVLVVVTDDQRAWADTSSVMPKTRAWLAQGGTTFTRAYATHPLCCPSRATIFTGRESHNHGVLTNAIQAGVERLDQRSTMQRYLKDAGYRTALAGKYLNTWDVNRNPPYFDRWALTNGGYADSYFNTDGRGAVARGYSTHVISQQALGFLRDFEADDARPWFLYVAPTAPHAPYVPEPAYADAPVPAFQTNPAVQEADRSDKAPAVRRWSTYELASLERALAVRRQQLRTLMSVDDMMGDLSGLLRQLGEDQNTLVFFVSDNGMLWGEHHLGAEKRFPYAPSVQVPYLVRWPGRLPAGSEAARLVGNVDVAPTVLQAAGIAPDPAYPMDGRSLLAPGRGRLFLEYWRSPDTPDLPGWASILTPTSQYVEWYEDDRVTISFREYYDLAADPWQLQNRLADADPANDPDVAALSRQLAADRDCPGTGCPPQPDLVLALADSPDPVVAGRNLTYGATVANRGRAGATSVQLDVVLPAGLAFVSATPSQGACSFKTALATVSCRLQALSPGSQARVSVVAKTSAAGTATTTGTATSYEPDAKFADNRVRPATTVVAAAT